MNAKQSPNHGWAKQAPKKHVVAFAEVVF